MGGLIRPATLGAKGHCQQISTAVVHAGRTAFNVGVKGGVGHAHEHPERAIADVGRPAHQHQRHELSAH